jgi:hypothetical protein
MPIVEDYFYDTEFWEQGPHQPVDLISIGVKRRIVPWGYYAVSNEFDFWGAWNYAGPKGDYWLRENVLKQLPLNIDGDGLHGLDLSNPAVKSLAAIRVDLEKFFELQQEQKKRRLWAWYADYDHVVLSQIWGTMAQLPAGMPMFTHDLKQVVDMAGNPPMPKQQTGQHHALDDAAHLQTMWEFCLRTGVLQPPPRPTRTASLLRPIRDNPQA